MKFRSKHKIEEIRKHLLRIAEDELSHYKSLKWQHTFIKKENSGKPIKFWKSLESVGKPHKEQRKSQISTLRGSNASVSDSDDDDSCSVSSTSDTNDLDLNDLIGDDFPILIVGNDASSKSDKAKNIPKMCEE